MLYFMKLQNMLAIISDFVPTEVDTFLSDICYENLPLFIPTG